MSASPDPIQDVEYIFWLEGWREVPSWPTSGQYKCTVTRQKIYVQPVDNDLDQELLLEISIIQHCNEYYSGLGVKRSVEVRFSDKRILLIPINPFEPNPTFYTNDNEVRSLIDVINAFRVNTKPQVHSNAYLRQLATRDSLKEIRSLDQTWDRDISPWTYYDIYGDKYRWPRVVTAILVTAIVMIALILGIAYVLDALGII